MYTYAFNNPLSYIDPTGNIVAPRQTSGVEFWMWSSQKHGSSSYLNGSWKSSSGIREAGPTSEYLSGWLEPGMREKYPSYAQYYSFIKEQASNSTKAYFWIPFSYYVQNSGYSIVDGKLCELQLPGSVVV